MNKRGLGTQNKYFLILIPDIRIEKLDPKRNKIKKKEGQRFCSSKLHGAKNNLHNSIKECDMIENA